MSVAGRLALLFVTVPIVELALLVQFGRTFGLWPTVALVLATGAAGAALARIEGMRVLFQFQQELAAGRIPGQAILDGLCVLVGAVFLLTPGVLTDLTGLSLLFPPTRRWIQRGVRKRLERAIAEGSVQVVTMGPGLGSWGRAPSAGGEGLDPSKGIVIEQDDG